jgi:hypothetical protein
VEGSRSDPVLQQHLQPIAGSPRSSTTTAPKRPRRGARASSPTWRVPPKGGDIDQINALVAGEGDIAVSNTYYFARLLSGDDDALKTKLAGCKVSSRTRTTAAPM